MAAENLLGSTANDLIQFEDCSFTTEGRIPELGDTQTEVFGDLMNLGIHYGSTNGSLPYNNTRISTDSLLSHSISKTTEPILQDLLTMENEEQQQYAGKLLLPQKQIEVENPFGSTNGSPPYWESPSIVKETAITKEVEIPFGGTTKSPPHWENTTYNATTTTSLSHNTLMEAKNTLLSHEIQRGIEKLHEDIQQLGKPNEETPFGGTDRSPPHWENTSNVTTNTTEQLIKELVDVAVQYESGYETNGTDLDDDDTSDLDNEASLLLSDQEEDHRPTVKIKAFGELRKVKRNALYVPMTFLDTTILCLVDSGAEVSILSSKVFNRIQHPNKPTPIPYEKKLVAANESEINNLGTVTIEADFGAQKFNFKTVVADIGLTDMLLGFDLLCQMNAVIFCSKEPSLGWLQQIVQEAIEIDGEGRGRIKFRPIPKTFSLPDNQLQKNPYRYKRDDDDDDDSSDALNNDADESSSDENEEEPVRLNRVSTAPKKKILRRRRYKYYECKVEDDDFRLFVHKTIVVPPRSERVIMAEFISTEAVDTDCYVEVLPKYDGLQGVKIARGVVNPRGTHTVPLRVMNPCLSPHKLFRGTQVATLQTDVEMSIDERSFDSDFTVDDLTPENVDSWDDFKPTAQDLPTDLYEFWQEDVKHLPSDEQEKWAKVMYAYKDVIQLDSLKNARKQRERKKKKKKSKKDDQIQSISLEDKPFSPRELPADLYKIWERDMASLPEGESLEWAKLLYRNQDIFVLDDSVPPGINVGFYHRIRLKTDTAPIKQRVRRVPMDQIPLIREEIEKMLKAGVISRSYSPWSSPVVLVRKRDGSVRFCIDYRRLNRSTIKDAYPLPRIDDALNALSKAKYSASLDLYSAYWQVPMYPDDKEKTAFATQQGLFEFNRMPFGLTNAPATFERLMELVLAGLTWDKCLVYLDDVMVFGETKEELKNNLEEVFLRLRDVDLRLKPKKCTFLKREILYLGYIVTPDGIRTDEEKVRVIRDVKSPLENLTAVRSFVGLTGFYRRFVEGYSKIMEPLTNLTKKNVKFEWSDACEKAFNTMKQKLTEAPILATPRFVPEADDEDGKVRFILDVDASNKAMGAVLMQRQDGENRVIAYASHVFSKAQESYCVTRKELLAIVTFLGQFRPIICGHEVTVNSDHRSLQWLLKLEDCGSQLARWSERLAAFDFIIKYRPGAQSKNADSMSRWPLSDPPVDDDCECRQCHRHACPDAVKYATIRNITLIEEDTTEFIRFQKEDSVLKKIFHWVKRGKPPTMDELDGESMEARHYAQCFGHLEIQDGVLVYNWETNDGERIPLKVLPRKLIPTVLNQMHSSEFSGHYGKEKTHQKVRQRFYWFRRRKDVEDFCRRCIPCEKRRIQKPKPRAPLVNIRCANPNDLVACDLMSLVDSPTEYRYVLIIIDYFTHWVEAIPLRSKNSQEVTKAIMSEYICRYGIPRRILTDRGGEFEADLPHELYKALGVYKVKTTAYRPNADGLAERTVQTFKQMLSKYIGENQHTWPQYLQQVCFAYRTTEQSSTRMTPSRMMFGRELNVPIDLIIPPPQGEKWAPTQTPENYVEELEASLERAFELAREYYPAAQRRAKKYYDRKAVPGNFKIGQRVWLASKRIIKGTSKKLLPYWDGPFVICKVLSPGGTFRVRHERFKTTQVVHFDRLRLCLSPPPKDTTEFITVEPPYVEGEDPIETEVIEIPSLESHDSDIVTDEIEYQVSKILRGRFRHGEPYYLVRWLGYGPRDDTWVKWSDLSTFTQEWLKQNPIPLHAAKHRRRTRRGILIPIQTDVHPTVGTETEAQLLEEPTKTDETLPTPTTEKVLPRRSPRLQKQALEPVLDDENATSEPEETPKLRRSTRIRKPVIREIQEGSNPLMGHRKKGKVPYTAAQVQEIRKKRKGIVKFPEDWLNGISLNYMTETKSQKKVTSVTRRETKKKYVGAHIPIDDGLPQAIYDAQEMGAKAIALFLKPPHVWNQTSLPERTIRQFRKAIDETKISIDMIVPHGSYFLNHGAPEEMFLQRSRRGLVQELRQCEQLGLKFLVIHPGSSCNKISREQCIENIANSINFALRRSKSCTILLENMSCQGHTIGGKFNELRQIIDKVHDKTRIAVCLDTAHAFAAGYDLRSPEGFEEMIQNFDAEIGLQNLRALHVNDSKEGLNSHRDLHENIGRGKIGTATFQRIMQDPRFDNMPLILETPIGMHAEEIELLYQLMETSTSDSSKTIPTPSIEVPEDIGIVMEELLAQVFWTAERKKISYIQERTHEPVCIRNIHVTPSTQPVLCDNSEYVLEYIGSNSYEEERYLYYGWKSELPKEADKLEALPNKDEETLKMLCQQNQQILKEVKKYREKYSFTVVSPDTQLFHVTLDNLICPECRATGLLHCYQGILDIAITVAEWMEDSSLQFRTALTDVEIKSLEDTIERMKSQELPDYWEWFLTLLAAQLKELKRILERKSIISESEKVSFVQMVYLKNVLENKPTTVKTKTKLKQLERVITCVMKIQNCTKSDPNESRGKIDRIKEKYGEVYDDRWKAFWPIPKPPMCISGFEGERVQLVYFDMLIQAAFALQKVFKSAWEVRKQYQKDVISKYLEKVRQVPETDDTIGDQMEKLQIELVQNLAIWRQLQNAELEKVLVTFMGQLDQANPWGNVMLLKKRINALGRLLDLVSWLDDFLETPIDYYELTDKPISNE